MTKFFKNSNKKKTIFRTIFVGHFGPFYPFWDRIYLKNLFLPLCSFFQFCVGIIVQKFRKGSWAYSQETSLKCKNKLTDWQAGIHRALPATTRDPKKIIRLYIIQYHLLSLIFSTQSWQAFEKLIRSYKFLYLITDIGYWHWIQEEWVK